MFDLSFTDYQRTICRRSFLNRSAYGLGGLALAWLLGDRAANRALGQPKPPHFPAKAKRVIHLCMAGGPSQFETLRLQARAQGPRRQAVPRVVHQGPAARAAAEHRAQGPRAVRASSRSTASRARRSPTCSRTSASIADDICDHPLDADRADQPRPGPRVHELRLDHQGPAEHGLVAALRPRRRDRRPARVHRAHVGRARPGCSRSRPGSGRPGSCRSQFQGIQFQSKGDAVHYVGNPDGVCQSTQRQVVEEVNRLNGLLADETARPGDRRPASPSTRWRSRCRRRCPS